MSSAPYQQLPDSDHEGYSDSGYQQKRPLRNAKKRADIQQTIREQNERPEPSGTMWTSCIGNLLQLEKISEAIKKQKMNIRVERIFSEVVFARAFERGKYVFFFRFGCVVGWDLTTQEKGLIKQSLLPFVDTPLSKDEVEEDDMNYVWSDKRQIRKDTIHLVTSDSFERLAYSYGLAQSVKLSVFENLVETTIESTKNIPEGLMTSGKIKLSREDISRKIGQLFVQRCYVNLHTDILDTPDIFWEFDEFVEHYNSCRSYLEIAKRVDILNQRLDIVKDLYDMLNTELSLQHGYKLEWIVIWLIVLEVAIEVIWNILIRDVLKLV